MTPERAKELLPVIQAFAEGKKIQTTNDIARLGWWDVDSPRFKDDMAYRIKPTKKEGWIVLCFEGVRYYTDGPFNNEQDARSRGNMSGNLLSIIKIEWEE